MATNSVHGTKKVNFELHHKRMICKGVDATEIITVVPPRGSPSPAATVTRPRVSTLPGREHDRCSRREAASYTAPAFMRQRDTDR